VQTDPSLADKIYLQPLNFDTVKRIIIKEKPDGILLGFGGQTALNLGLNLEENGLLKKYKVTVLGTSVASIRRTEDRDLFKAALARIKIKTPLSFAVKTVAEALKAAEKIGYPIMLRSGFSLGGLGSGKIIHREMLEQRAQESLATAPQILIEEYLFGWKEFEYEIVRDREGNALTICNMENMDPMGIHTGESIVVAPAQTLNNEQHQLLRTIALQVAEHFNKSFLQHIFCIGQRFGVAVTDTQHGFSKSIVELLLRHAVATQTFFYELPLIDHSGFVMG